MKCLTKNPLTIVSILNNNLVEPLTWLPLKTIQTFFDVENRLLRVEGKVDVQASPGLNHAYDLLFPDCHSQIRGLL